MTSVDRQAARPARSELHPPVAVVIPTRDRPELLRRAVRRVMAQTYPGSVECLVVFDQAEPSDVPVDLPDGRALRTLRNDRTPGLAGARNTGILATEQTLVAFCDDDDEWLPDKLAAQVEALRAAPEAVAVATGIEIRTPERAIRRVPRSTRYTHRDFLRSRVMELHPSTMVARREDFLGRIGLVDEAIAGSYAEDYEWILRATRIGPVAAVPRPLVRVHWHRSSWFAGRWRTIADALRYLLRKFPEFETEPRGLARILGQIAFAEAASGDRAAGRRWARRCFRTDWREPRAYLALLVGMGLVSPDRVVAAANRFGRGV